jgi:hypothetical protein
LKRYWVPPCGISPERARRASEHLSDNVAFLSENWQPTGFSAENFTGVEGRACARRWSGFFYGLVRRINATPDNVDDPM